MIEKLYDWQSVLQSWAINFIARNFANLFCEKWNMFAKMNVLSNTFTQKCDKLQYFSIHFLLGHEIWYLWQNFMLQKMQHFLLVHEIWFL